MTVRAVTAQEARPKVGGQSPPRRPSWAWRLLGAFWGLVVLLLGAGAGVLQHLGPPHPLLAAGGTPGKPAVQDHPAKASPMISAHTPATAPVSPSQEAAVSHTPSPPTASPASALSSTSQPALASGAVAAPDPALLEPSTLYAGGSLPRIGADRRKARHVYAARFNMADPRPRIAILLAGIGMNEAESTAAVTNLPAAVSLAVPPYATRLDTLLEAARSRGHEFLVSIPMEPQGYPLNDPGNQALLTGASQATNALRLEWALTRMSGYVGATGALGEMRGERFAAATDQMAPMLGTLADRGLLYVDPRPELLQGPGSSPQPEAFRGVDLLIDDPPGAQEVDRQLERLERVARDRGAALGLAARPSPITVDRIATWAVGLNARGLALAPVSVVVQMPQPPAPTVRVNLPR